MPITLRVEPQPSFPGEILVVLDRRLGGLRRSSEVRHLSLCSCSVGSSGGTSETSLYPGSYLIHRACSVWRLKLFQCAVPSSPHLRTDLGTAGGVKMAELADTGSSSSCHCPSLSNPCVGAAKSCASAVRALSHSPTYSRTPACDPLRSDARGQGSPRPQHPSEEESILNSNLTLCLQMLQLRVHQTQACECTA